MRIIEKPDDRHLVPTCAGGVFYVERKRTGRLVAAFEYGLRKEFGCGTVASLAMRNWLEAREDAATLRVTHIPRG